MKAVLLVPRLPGTGHTGDRLRAELHLAALARAGYETAVVGGVGGGEEILRVENAAAVHPVRLQRISLPMRLASAAISGEPLQSALFAGSFRSSLSDAARGADLLVCVLLPRLLAHVGTLPALPRVVDYVDALAAAARQAANEDPAPWRRAYWEAEAPRLARAEARAAEGASVLFATTPFDAAHLPPGTRAVANGVVVGPLAPGPRGPVVAFSGRLRYRPNVLAVKRLLDDVWPRVRRDAPAARLVLGGADAPAWLLARSGKDGVEVVSPVPDMAAFLRTARVAAAPVAMGTGTPNKIFEAFEAGAAVVASPEVAERAAAGGEAPPVRTARTDEEFAAALVALLNDPEAAAAEGARARGWVEAHADRRESVNALAAGYREARERA
ncbi:MAG TPA: glycosyltransferase family 4 protein [Thermoanaerobaculia bacterium]